MKQLLFITLAIIFCGTAALGQQQQGQALLKIVVEKGQIVKITDAHNNSTIQPASKIGINIPNGSAVIKDLTTSREQEAITYRQSLGKLTQDGKKVSTVAEKAVLQDLMNSQEPEAVAYRQKLMEKGLLAVNEKAVSQDLQGSGDPEAVNWLKQLQKTSEPDKTGVSTLQNSEGSQDPEVLEWLRKHQNRNDVALKGTPLSQTLEGSQDPEAIAWLKEQQGREEATLKGAPLLQKLEDSQDPEAIAWRRQQQGREEATLKGAPLLQKLEDSQDPEARAWHQLQQGREEKGASLLQTLEDSQDPEARAWLKKQQSNDRAGSASLQNLNGSRDAEAVAWLRQFNETSFEGVSSRQVLNGMQDSEAVQLKKQQSEKQASGITVPNLTFDFNNSNWSYNSTTKVVTQNTLVLNTGTLTSGACRLGYYLSPNNVISTGDTFIGSDIIPSLGAGGSSSQTFSLNVCSPQVVSDGSYWLGWIVDDQSVVAESDESDNFAVSASSISIICTTTLPNLTFDFNNTTWGYNSTTNILTQNTLVLNNGNATSGACRLGYYLSSNNVISTGDTFIGSDNIPSLGAGGSSSQTFSLNVCSPPVVSDGTYWIGWIVDDQGVVGESSESDNTAISTSSISIVCVVQQPNLTFDFNNTTWSYNSSTNILAQNTLVLNNGTGTSGACRLGYYLSTNNVISTGDTFIGSDNIPSLGAGGSSSQTFSLNVCSPPVVSDGTYWIGWIVDDQFVVSESNESDNTAVSVSSIVITCQFPNLTFDFNNTNWSYNSTTRILTQNTLVLNSGTATSGSCRLGYYLSNNNVISTGDTFTGSDIIPSLGAGGSSSQTFSLNVCPPVVSDGTYWLGWIVDDQGVVAESNEGDNFAVSASSIVITCLFPNLTFDFNNTNWSYNSTTKILAQNTLVLNNGAATSGACRLGYYLSTNNVISTGDTFIGSDNIPSLGVGGSSSQTFSLNVCNPRVVNDGTYWLGWIVDDQGVVTESNEGDNTAVSASSIFISCPLLPNLTFDFNNTTWSYNSTTNILAQNTLVLNNGTGTSGACRLGYYLSTNNVISTGDTFIGSDNIPSLGVGGSSSQTFSLNVCNPRVVNDGTYWLGWIVDDQSVVVESNEADNFAVSASSIVITCLFPNLTFDFNNTNWSYNSTTKVVTQNTLVLNTGTTTSGACRLGYYLSTSNSISTSDTFIGSDNIPSLVVGGSSSQTFSLNVCNPRVVNDGTYWLGWIVDDQGVVTESNEGDNTAVSASSIFISCPLLPNLTFDFNNTTWSYNSTTNILAQNTLVLNNGTGTSGACRLGYYLSTNNVISTGDTFLGSDNIPSLGASGSSSQTFSLNVCNPRVVNDGTYWLGWIVDDQSVVVESNEADNFAVSASSIAIVCPVTNLTFDFNNTTWSYNSTTKVVTQNTLVLNNGTGTSGACRLGYYLSTNNVISTGDTFTGSDNIPSLAAGGSSSQTFSLNVCSPRVVNDGTYWLGWIVDDQGVVTESNEADNFAVSASSIVITCPAACNPVARVDCASPFAQGSQFTVTMFVNMSSCSSPDDKLGSYTSRLTWNPALVSYVSNSGLQSGFTGAINTTNVGSGTLEFNGANPAGAGADVRLLSVTFQAVGAGGTGGILDLSFSAMAAATSFTNLLPSLTTNDCNYQIVTGCVCGDVNGDGAVNSTDCLIILSHDAGIPIPAAFLARINQGCADLNIDGVTNSTDALICLTCDAGLPQCPSRVGQPGGCR